MLPWIRKTSLYFILAKTPAQLIMIGGNKRNATREFSLVALSDIEFKNSVHRAGSWNLLEPTRIDKYLRLRSVPLTLLYSANHGKIPFDTRHARLPAGWDPQTGCFFEL